MMKVSAAMRAMASCYSGQIWVVSVEQVRRRRIEQHCIVRRDSCMHFRWYLYSPHLGNWDPELLPDAGIGAHCSHC